MMLLKFKCCSESLGLLKGDYWIQAENLHFSKFSGDGMLLVQEPQFGYHCLHNKFILLSFFFFFLVLLIRLHSQITAFKLSRFRFSCSPVSFCSPADTKSQ